MRPNAVEAGGDAEQSLLADVAFPAETEAANGVKSVVVVVVVVVLLLVY